MGWSTENLGDLYKIGSSKRVLKSQWQTSGVPFYRGREITILSKHGEVSNELFISEELYQEYAKKHGVPATEDIVITAIGTIGNSYIVSANDRFYFKDASVLWLKKTSNVDSSFINLWLKSSLMREQLDEGNGATVDTLTIKKLQSLQVKLPPIPEQQRIVAILDQAFADIEKARANAEKNLKNARELFDSYLQQVFSQRGEGWVEEVLGRVCDVRDGTHDSPKYVDEGIPFITQKNIRTDGLSFEKTKFISETDHMKFYKRSNVTHGDILISMIGVNRGMACVVDDHRIFSIKNVGLIKKALNINPLFLLFYLKSHTAKKYIESESRGGAQPFIGLTKLRAFPVLLASPEEQEEVVSKLTLIEARTENLVLIYETKLKSLEELKKSLLQKAFSGELTKTEGMVA